MDAPERLEIKVGVAHRALQTIRVSIYDYDELGLASRTMKRGELFQPWEPLPHWRGERVPITLGVGASGFDWGVTSMKGHFLDWEDFFERCAPLEATHVEAKSRIREAPLASPFDELTTIAERLRRENRKDFIEDVIAKLESLRAAYAAAAESELAALGFDNTASARVYEEEKLRILAEARVILRTARQRRSG